MNKAHYNMSKQSTTKANDVQIHVTSLHKPPKNKHVYIYIYTYITFIAKKCYNE